MKKYAVTLLTLLIASAVVLASCAPAAPVEEAAPAVEEAAPVVEEAAPAEPVVFNWNLGSAGPKTLDPGMNGASDGGDILSNTFEGLVRERSGVVQPGIAESWETSDDGLVWTFYLRESNWSDGSPLTANDFEYAWKRAMDPATASEYSWIWSYTNVVNAADFAYGEEGVTADDVGVKAVDDYTLEVTLSAPTDYFGSLMAFYHFMPVKQSAVEAAGGEDGTWASNPDLFVGNGAFMLTEYTIGEGMKLVKNPEYWNADVVKIDEMNVAFLDDANTAYAAYQAGDFLFIPDVPTAEIPRLIEEDPNFYVFPLLGTYYYNFNMDLDLWSDVRVRKAFALAINRQEIVDTLASGQVPAAGFVPPGFKDDQGRDFFETSGTYGLVTDDSGVAEAQALMAEAGYPNGEGFPEFEMLYNTSEGHQTVAELIQEQLKTNLGVNATLANQEWAVFQDTRTQGDYEFARGGWLTDFMDPSGMLAIFQDGNAYNDPNYFNADFEAAMAAALATTDKAEHFNQLYIAQEILMTDLPIVPIYHYSDTMLASERLVGWDRSVLGGLDFTTAYIVD